MLDFKQNQQIPLKVGETEPDFHFLKQIAESAPANRARESASSTTDSWLPDTHRRYCPRW